MTEQLFFLFLVYHCVVLLQIRGGSHIILVLFLHENICCGYSLEVPWQGASDEYPQHMFSWRNKKNISTFWLKKLFYPELGLYQ